MSKFAVGFLAGFGFWYGLGELGKRWLDDAGRAEKQQGSVSPTTWASSTKQYRP